MIILLRNKCNKLVNKYSKFDIIESNIFLILKIKCLLLNSKCKCNVAN